MAFFFHWIDIGTTEEEWKAASTWDPAFAVSDEDLLNLRIDHDEGQIPSLTVQIRNPQIGLLNPSRKLWAWLSWDGPGYAEPLFFGRLVAIPTDLLGEAVTLQFTARSKNYVIDKQIAAESLKVRPYYDPVFIDVTKRDDPDTILEGYSALWHIDRVTSQVSPSDILVGEGGTAIFLPSEIPYESVQVSLQQTPLIAIAVTAAVSWTQQFSGFLSTGQGLIYTYSGDGIVSDWPKPASDLGGGWRVMSSFVKDLNRVENVENVQYSTSWQNTEKNHHDGDWMSHSVSHDYPIFFLNTSYISMEITRDEVVGLQDPHTVDIYGNPAPTNIPSSLRWTASYVPIWRVKYNMGLRYDADRARTERVEFILQADAQPILADASINEETDNIDITGADVGEPIINFRNWTSVAGKYVEIGSFVFPDNPLVAGQKSIQVCIVAGVAGTTVPTFSNVAGETTQDGTVTWSSLGYASGIYNISTDWTRDALVPLGEIILPRIPFTIPYSDYVMPGRMQDPEVGVPVEKYLIVFVPNYGYFQCSLSGTTGIKNPKWNVSGITKDATVEWTFIGTALPSGVDYYICTHSGTTGETLPRFGDGTTLVNDGTVVWTKLPASEVPIGGAPGMIGRNDYFPTDRGNWSLEYLMCLARARLRMRSRAVEIGFECRFERAAQLSCRMNATIYDHRLPGGTATGKVIGYSLIADGDAGVLMGKVKIGCAVGRNNVLTTAIGSPTYVSLDYVEAAYQEISGAITPATDDVGYSPPASNSEDKFVFPLTTDQVFVNGGIQQRGSLAAQQAGIWSALNTAYITANLAPTTVDSLEDALKVQYLAHQAAKNTVQIQLQRNPIWLEFEILPVSGLVYDNFYSIETTQLMLPKMIDLEASSTVTPPTTGGNIVYATANFQGVGNRDISTNIPMGNAGAVIPGSSTLGAKTILDAQGYGRVAGSGKFDINVYTMTFQKGGAANIALSGIMIARTRKMIAFGYGFSLTGSMTATSLLRAGITRSFNGAGSLAVVTDGVARGALFNGAGAGSFAATSMYVARRALARGAGAGSMTTVTTGPRVAVASFGGAGGMSAVGT